MDYLQLRVKGNNLKHTFSNTLDPSYDAHRVRALVISYEFLLIRGRTWLYIHKQSS